MSQPSSRQPPRRLVAESRALQPVEKDPLAPLQWPLFPPPPPPSPPPRPVAGGAAAAAQPDRWPARAGQAVVVLLIRTDSLLCTERQADSAIKLLPFYDQTAIY